MQDWRKALQSNAMRNIAIGFLAADAVGIYVAQDQLNQPVPADVEMKLTRAPVVAAQDLDLGLPQISPLKIAPATRSAMKEPEPRFVPIRADAATQDERLAAADLLPTPEARPVAHAANAPVKIAVAKSVFRAAPFSVAFRSAFAGMDRVADSVTSASQSGELRAAGDSPRASSQLAPTISPDVAGLAEQNASPRLPNLTAHTDLGDTAEVGATSRLSAPSGGIQTEPTATASVGANS